MDNIDLTNDKVFSKKTNLNILKINLRKKKSYINEPFIKQSFIGEHDWGFERDTGMTTNKISTFRKEVIEVELGLRCECCGRYISSLNAIYSLCNHCDDSMFNTQNESAAYRNLDFDTLKELRNNKERIKTNEERDTYVQLFLDAQ